MVHNSFFERFTCSSVQQIVLHLSTLFVNVFICVDIWSSTVILLLALKFSALLEFSLIFCMICLILKYHNCQQLYSFP